MISKSIGIPSHFEVIVISVIAICVLSLDRSVSTLVEDLQEIWDYDFGEKIQEDVEMYLKYSLSGVVLMKALTLHLFLALHFLLLWTTNVEEKPNLILPWLFIGLFRSIFLNVLAFSTGLYVCLIQKGYHPVCLEYVLAQAIQHGPEVYAWLSVISYYKVLMLSSRMRPLIDERTSTKVIPQSKNKYLSRTKFIDSMEDGRNVITESAIDNVINHMKSMQCPSRSLDALINLKSSKIRKNYYEIEDGQESIAEKVMRLLNVVYDDIKKAKIAKEKRLPWKITDLNLEKLLVPDIFVNLGLVTTIWVDTVHHMLPERKRPNIYTYEKDQPVSSLEKKRTLSVESVYQEAIANEVELDCVSLGGSNTSCFHSENED